MKGFVNGYDWLNAKAMKYWAFGKNVDNETRLSTVRNAVFGGDYIGALKVDGYYQRILKDEDGQIYMIARDRNVKGEITDKHEWIPHLNPWFDSLPNGTCFLCECYWPGNEGSKKITTILGCLKEKAIQRQEKAPLHLYVFDVMAYAGQNFDKTPYEDRARLVEELSKKHPFEYVEFAKYFEGKELWAHLQDYLAQDREGMVIMRKDAIVYDKRTPARVSIKVKKEIRQTIDCFFTGLGSAPTHEYTGKEIQNWTYWENQITRNKLNGELYGEYTKGAPIIPVTKGYFNGWCGSLQIAVLKSAPGHKVKLGDRVYENYELFPIGWLSGVTEEMKANPMKFANKPIEVTAMEYDAIAHTLRHGKMLSWREDLTLEDCTFDKIEA